MKFGTGALRWCPGEHGCCLRWDSHAASLSRIEQAGLLKGLLIELQG